MDHHAIEENVAVHPDNLEFEGVKSGIIWLFVCSVCLFYFVQYL
jgi:hypothetical protein